MTIDTSREAVEALIAYLRKDAERDAAHRNEHERATRFNRKTMPSWVAADALAALLDERDRLAANRDAWVSDAMTSTTELEQRIRDLEVTNRKISERSANHHDNAIKWRERAERAEAELLHASGISEIRGAERDKLAAKLDAVKAWSEVDRYRISGDRDSWDTYYEGIDAAQGEVLAILADTETREEGDL